MYTCATIKKFHAISVLTIRYIHVKPESYWVSEMLMVRAGCHMLLTCAVDQSSSSGSTGSKVTGVTMSRGLKRVRTTAASCHRKLIYLKLQNILKSHLMSLFEIHAYTNSLLEEEADICERCTYVSIKQQ